MSVSQAKKRLKVTTYSKVVFLLTVAAICFFLLYAILFYYSLQQQKQFKKQITEQFNNEIKALLEHDSESYVNLIEEITFWDELVNFVEKKDLLWFNNSVAYLVDTNRADYIDAYNLKGEFVSKVSTNEITSKDFIPKEIFPILFKNKIIQFNLKIKEGYVKVYGATIHPSEDPFKNKTQPRGYFFIVKLIGNKYFSELEKVSSSKISFTDVEKSNYNLIVSKQPLLDYNGKIIQKIVFERLNNVNFTTTKKILGILFLGSLIAFCIFFYYAKRWSKTPLSLITKALMGKNEAIQSLKNIKGEFRFIGKLLEVNLHQKQMLENSKSKIQESDNLKSAFLMNLSHEIRTPMNAIIGFSDLLSNPEITKSEQSEYIQIIKSSGYNLINIIDDLVEMSRIDSNLVIPNWDLVDLESMLEVNFNAVAITNQKKNLDFKLIKPEKKIDTKIITDPTKLNQIIVNLLNNALKFTDDGFVIFDYEVDEVNQKINFEVKDSGIGIHDDFKNKIFQRFSKTNTHSISANEGLGLGLSICKAYIDMLGGEISISSQVGVGSIFRFWIPLKYEAELNYDSIQKTISTDLIWNDTIKILIAEDDNVNFMLIKQMLKSDKIEIIRAINGQEVIDICKENTQLNLIFMDIRMPIKNGHEAFKGIREFNKTVPIIAQTSYSFPDEIDKILQTGFNDYISKPLNKESILNLVKKYT